MRYSTLSKLKIDYLRPFACYLASFKFIFNKFYYFGYKNVKTGFLAVHMNKASHALEEKSTIFPTE